jgi:transcriptional regulator with XRE-family HTH domain
MKKLKQSQLAKELGISNSYLSMILSGRREAPPELLEKLQSIPGVHKIVKKPIWESPSKQAVAGSSPVSRSTKSRWGDCFSIWVSGITSSVSLWP